MSKEEAIHELYKICKDINFDEADDMYVPRREQHWRARLAMNEISGMEIG